MANAIDQLTDRVLMLGRLTIVRRAITAVAVTISAVLQTFLIQAFIPVSYTHLTLPTNSLV